jgi:hypothetical protein
VAPNPAVEVDGHKLRLWFPTLRSGRPHFHGRAHTMKVLLAIALALFVTASASATGTSCAKADASFGDFLRRFGENKQFQKQRIVLPLVARFGDYQVADPQIKLLSSSELDKLDYPLFRSNSEMRRDAIAQSVLLATKRYAEVIQDQDEADSDRVLFKFRSIGGCWFLEELHDTSL